MEKVGPGGGPTCRHRTKNHPGGKKSLVYPYSRIADKYGLRPRTIIRRLMQARRPRDTSQRLIRVRPQPLTKHRKKLACTRERSYMREINQAFENLRNVLPAAADCRNDDSAVAKMTTIRLALRYITALTHLLEEDDAERSDSSSNSSQDEKVSSCSQACCDASQSSFTSDDEPQEPSQRDRDHQLPEDTYILALAKIFDESDHFNDTGDLDGNKDYLSYPPDHDDLVNSRGDFSDLSDHDVEGQLEALVDIGQ